MKIDKACLFLLIPFCLSLAGCSSREKGLDAIRSGFLTPPNDARPGVYWYFMDGNLSREGITADLEEMKAAGIGNVLFLEVNVGVPRGKVDFLSDEWQSLFVHAVNEAQRIGIELTMGSGPGWAGSGGPWVKPEQSMRNLVASDTVVTGPAKFDAVPVLPPSYKPPYNYWPLTPELEKLRNDYYKDVCVLAFPTPAEGKIADIGEKALYYRAPYTSMRGVKPRLTSVSEYDEAAGAAIDHGKVIDLTDRMDAYGRLKWDVPSGKWTIMRFVLRNNGVVSRPAPEPGLGFECDKFDTTHLNSYFDAYLGALLRKTGKTVQINGETEQTNINYEQKTGNTGQKTGNAGHVEKHVGWTMLHVDSWEMSSQNWSDNFREEFIRRRGYDPLRYLPVYTGLIIDNTDVSERFLWDVRQTAMELTVENYAGHLKTLGRRYGLTMSLQPYDMNPASDFDLGAVADMPGCEFWASGYGYNTVFACTEAASIAHVYGLPVVEAEAFTAHSEEGWTLYPATVKNQGDWAFAAGINRFVYHTHAHKPFLSDKVRPGMTMGPYGVHWDRGQTWWSLSSAYHRYVARCQYLLRQGRSVADILYLNPEGAPQVFTPPASVFTYDSATTTVDVADLKKQSAMPDRRGYNFDVCSPAALVELADVRDGRVVFTSGASYRVLVLPNSATMTHRLMRKIETLVENGATIVGNPPVKSPSLTDYPNCDAELRKCVERLWGKSRTIPDVAVESKYGNGTLLWGGAYSRYAADEIYPDYVTIAGLLDSLGERYDFVSRGGKIRYTHRTIENKALGDTETVSGHSANSDIYFVANRTAETFKDVCTFRATGTPELWNPIDGDMRCIEDYSTANGTVSVTLEFAPHQSYFVVFYNTKGSKPEKTFRLSETKELKRIDEPWDVRFDTTLGGLSMTRFDKLSDWSENADERIRYYSGSAHYSTTFDIGVFDKKAALILDLGKVRNIARVKLNGKDLGIVWTAPWQVNISGVAKEKGNTLEIEVANLWVNRFIGDERLPYDGVENGKFPDWLLNGTPRTSGRITFTTSRNYSKDSPLIESGLIGPVRIMIERNNASIERNNASESKSACFFECSLKDSVGTVINVPSCITVWNCNEAMRNVPADYYRENLPFVEYAQICMATGGNYYRDHFRDPRNLSVNDDYDFTKLVGYCRRLLERGLKPYLKLGNVPHKLSTGYDVMEFAVNVRPPADYNWWRSYVTAMARTLVDTFGVETVRGWSFGSVQEYNHYEWFSVGDNDPRATDEAICKLYDYTIDALQQVLGDDVCVGVHSMAGDDRESTLIRHCARGKNYITGKTGTRLCFVATSFYHNAITTAGNWDANFMNSIRRMRSVAEDNGLNYLFYIVDEGFMLGGREVLPLAPRLVGFTWQAAYNARSFLWALDERVASFSYWNHAKGELLSTSAQSALLFHRMSGANRLNLVRDSASFKHYISSDSTVDVNGVASYDMRRNKLYLYIYSYSGEPERKVDIGVRFTFSDVPYSGETKAVRTLISDHSNRFDEWLADMRDKGLTDEQLRSDEGWSHEGFVVRDDLLDPARLHAYKDASRLRPEPETLRVVNGKLEVCSVLPLHCVALYEIDCNKS